ncbi:MAG: hypothetical protein ABR537_12965 [Gemmatimonadales bacterium]
MRRVFLAATAVVAFACAPKSPPSTTPTPVNPPPGPPAAPPPPAQTQSLRLGPSALRYAMHQSIHIDQEFQGMRQPLDFGLRAVFAVTITGPADTSGYPTTITIDSIVPDSGTTVPMGINLGAARGLSFAGRLSPSGEFRNQVPSDSMAALSLAPLVGSFRNFFPRLPATGLTLGATWTDTSTMNDRAAGNVTVTNINHSHAAAWEDHNGTRSVRVEVSSTFTIKGGGEQAGQPFEVAGNGVRNGVDYIAADGRFLGGESHDSTSMTITLPVQAMTIPRTQVSKTTVQVLP